MPTQNKDKSKGGSLPAPSCCKGKEGSKLQPNKQLESVLKKSFHPNKVRFAKGTSQGSNQKVSPTACQQFKPRAPGEKVQGHVQGRGANNSEKPQLMDEANSCLPLVPQERKAKKAKDLPLGGLGRGGMFFFGGSAGVSALLLKGSSRKPPPPKEELNGSEARGWSKEHRRRDPFRPWLPERDRAS